MSFKLRNVSTLTARRGDSAGKIIVLADSQMYTKGNGIYIVGLDNHVGLYQVKNEESWFCHSTVIYPSCVIKEKAAYSPALQYSSYRVVGKLSDYETLTKQWLLNEYINLK